MAANNIRSKRIRWIVACVVGVSLVVHLGLLLLGRSLLDQWRWPHHSVHAAIETAGAAAALWVAWMLASMYRRGTGTSYNNRIAGALVGMGVLDGFHALCQEGDTFVWLHSLATCLGGVLFSLIWIPDRSWRSLDRRWPKLVLVGSLLLGAASLAFWEFAPPMVRGGEFTLLARWLNIAGGMLMLLAAARLVCSHLVNRNDDDLLFCVHCLLFAAAAIMFEQSSLWDVPWWGWHALRLAAYGVAMLLIVKENPYHAQELLLIHQADLKRLIEHRTSELQDNTRRLQASETLLREQAVFLEEERRAAVRLRQEAEGDRRRAEEAERRALVTIEASPSGMIMVDAQGEIVLTNSRIEHIFGYRRDELLGRRVEMLLPEQDREQHVELRQGFLQTPKSRMMGGLNDLHGRHKDGRLIPIEVGLNPVELDSGRFVLATVLDITIRKRFELAMERSNQELESFAYVASHDLQEPLRKISSFCRLLEMECGDNLPDDAKEYLRLAVDGADRMRGLIQDLLAYSRVKSQGAPLTPTDAEAALKTALWNLESAIEETGAVVTHDSLPIVLADRRQLAQLLQNLIGNGVKYHGAEPPRIHVRAEQQEGVWRFSISDNGIGVAPKCHERIFGVFKRLHRQEEYPGTGIGLAVCKRIAERFEGRIWLESEEGQGSTFYFTALPANAESRDAPAAVDEQELVGAH